jgi:preprotein translocase subunit SecD
VKKLQKRCVVGIGSAKFSDAALHCGMHFKAALKTVALALAATSFTLSAFAQWQWIDKDGRKVFSDRSPPAEISEKDILKRPGGRAPVAVAAVSESAPAAPALAASAAAKPSAPKLMGKDAQLEAKKKQAEEEEAAKKKAEGEKVAAAKADNCDQAKRYLTTLDSGVRIANTNAKGEREVMDDSKRAEEKKRAQGVADTSCK